MTDPRLRQLEEENARLRRINTVLMDRVERSMDMQGDAFSIFQTAVQLEDRVRDRTQELEQVLDELSSARRLLSDAIESIDEGFALYDAEDRFVMCNSRLRWMMQFTPSPDSTFSDVLRHVQSRNLLPEANDDPEGWLANRLQQHRNPGPPVIIRFGQDRWLRISERRITDGGIVSLYTDITEIKQREEQRRQQELAEKSVLLQSTLDNLEQGVAVVDATNRLLTWNPRFLSLLDVSDRDVRSGLFLHALPGLDELGRFDGPPRTEHRLDTPLRILDIQRTALPDGGQVITISDTTERRNKESQILRAVQHLTAANTELDRFAYVASHDLREPLRTIVSFTQLLQRKLTLKGDCAEYMDLIIGAGTRMNDLIGGLLQYSRLSSHAHPFQPCDMELICAMVRDNLRASIEHTQAQLTMTTLPVVMADPVQISQLLQNLISNALKYRRPDVTPIIGVSARRDGDEWRITIQDNGIGIEETGHDIYEIFRRLHSSTAYPGTGIGLAICRRIIQHHGGRLWHEPAPGHGTLFHFTLGTGPNILEPTPEP